ncbi:MAG TPA: hypothetical protein VH280_00755 [Verrucomicrobiae bacterium]|jgi:hypothetical protein|nr:hypothetical protein [Verrucomicrobiae bacterium]
MKSTEDNADPVEPSRRGQLVPGIEPSAENREELTGLPGLRTWRDVYIFVFGCFLLWVSLLLLLTVFYS